jgi:hypothetical protein
MFRNHCQIAIKHLDARAKPKRRVPLRWLLDMEFIDGSVGHRGRLIGDHGKRGRNRVRTRILQGKQTSESCCHLIMTTAPCRAAGCNISE